MSSKDALRTKQRRDSFKARGICYVCEKVDVSSTGKNVCQTCREALSKKHKQYRKDNLKYCRYMCNQANIKRRKDLKAQGLCSKCGGTREDPKFAMCLACRNKVAKYVSEKYRTSTKYRKDQVKRERARQAANRKKGLCFCGKERRPGFKTCQMCYDRVRRHQPTPKYITGEPRKTQEKQHGEMTRTEVRRMWGALGLCRWCGRPRAKGAIFCPLCLVTYEKSKAKRRKKKV